MMRRLLFGSGGAAAPVSKTIVDAKFTGTDGTAITDYTPDVSPGGAKFATLAGNAMRIVSNKCQTNAVPADNDIAAIETGVADCRISCDCSVAVDHWANLAVRISDTTHYWVAYQSGSAQVLYERNGTYVQRATQTVNVTAPGTMALAVELSGNNISYTVNGGTPLTYSSSFNATATKHGTRSSGPGQSTWDNFLVERL